MVSVKCPRETCGRSFPSYAALIVHMQEHIKEERENVEREIERRKESENKEDKRLTDLRVQVESARLKRELREIEKGQPTAKEKSALDQFTELEKFRSAIVEAEEKKRESLRSLIKEELQDLEGLEAQDPALPLIMKIIENSKKQPAGIQPTNITPADQIKGISGYSIDQLIAAVPAHIKKKIKTGKITKAQAAAWAKSQNITKDLFEAVWLQLTKKSA